MTPEAAQQAQQQVSKAREHLLAVSRERDQIFLQLQRAGHSPRQIAKIVGVNHSNVYKILERAGYVPAFSFKQGRLRNLTQQAIIEDLRKSAKMKAKPRV